MKDGRIPYEVRYSFEKIKHTRKIIIKVGFVVENIVEDKKEIIDFAKKRLEEIYINKLRDIVAYYDNPTFRNYANEEFLDR